MSRTAKHSACFSCSGWVFFVCFLPHELGVITLLMGKLKLREADGLDWVYIWGQWQSLSLNPDSSDTRSLA